jgi:23S rRNA (cytosine1962-C5)-methyltransferase
MSWHPTGEVIVDKRGTSLILSGRFNIGLNMIKKLIGPVSRGDVVIVKDENGEFLGEGFYEEIGSVGVRMLAFKDRISLDLIDERMKNALDMRKRMKLGNYFRLVHSESDLLPGLIIDFYNDIASITSTSVGFDGRIKDIANILIKLGARAVFARNDSRTRRQIDLPLWKGKIAGEGPSDTIIDEEGVLFHVDVLKGQKTGFFIDQRMNRISLRRYISKGDSVLDLFSYTGGFGLHAAVEGANVTAVDESDYAEEEIVRNAELNKVKINFIKRNVKELKIEGEYDVVIADPPALIPSIDRKDAGKKAYLTLNTKIMNMVRKGGFIFTFSCSQFLSQEELKGIVIKAGDKSGRNIKLLNGVLGQSPDHPVDPKHPWTGYLKGFIVNCT